MHGKILRLHVDVWCWFAVGMQTVGFAGVQGVPMDRTVAQVHKQH